MACSSALVSRSNISVIHCFFITFVLYLSFCPFALAEPESDAAHIFTLINERLGYMEKVALYKHQLHMSVEDLTREKFIWINHYCPPQSRGWILTLYPTSFSLK